MRTVTILSVTFLFFSFFTLSAQEVSKRKFHLEAEPVASYSQGHLTETFFHSRFNDDTQKRSQLDWDRNIFLFGVNVFTVYNTIHCDIGFATSLINQNSGKMSDSDWLNTNDYAMKTTYSTGDNTAAESYTADIKLSYDFQVENWITISPIVSLYYAFDSFFRKDSEGWYGQAEYSSDMKHHWWYDSEAKHYPYTYWSEERGRYVTVKLGEIGLDAHSLLTFFGISAKISPVSNVDVAFSAVLSPFSYFYSIDSHLAQDSDTKTLYKKHFRMIQFSYFNTVSLCCSLNWKISRMFAISIQSDYTFTFEVIRGTLYSDTFNGVKEDSYRNTGQDSGLGFERLSVKTGFRIKVL